MGLFDFFKRGNIKDSSTEPTETKPTVESNEDKDFYERIEERKAEARKAREEARKASIEKRMKLSAQMEIPRDELRRDEVERTVRIAQDYEEMRKDVEKDKEQQNLDKEFAEWIEQQNVREGRKIPIAEYDEYYVRFLEAREKETRDEEPGETEEPEDDYLLL